MNNLDLNWVPVALLILVVGVYYILKLWIGHVERMAEFKKQNKPLDESNKSSGPKIG